MFPDNAASQDLRSLPELPKAPKLPNRRQFLTGTVAAISGFVGYEALKRLGVGNKDKFNFASANLSSEFLDKLGYDVEIQRGAVDLAYNLQLNGHAIEGRGKELATYIWNVVDAAFNHPDPNKNPFNNSKKTMLCALEKVVNGCSRVVQYVVEVESRTTPGVQRLASVIFGMDENTKEWRVITALYKNGPIDKFIESQKARGLTSDGCDDGVPPSGFFFAAP